MLHTKIIILFIVSILSVNSLMAADSQNVIKFSSTDKQLNLDSYIDILVDDNQKLTIEDIVKVDARHNFQPATLIGNNFGFSSAAYWVRFSLLPDASLNDSLVLQLEYPLVDNVTFFAPDGQGGFNEIVTGDSIPFRMREINYRTFLFTLPQHHGKTRTYYMRIQTEGSSLIPLSLWSKTALMVNTNTLNISVGFYYGIMSLMLFASIITFFKLRKRLYLYYSLCLFSYLLFQLSLNGLSFQYIWPEFPWFNNRAVAIIISCVTISTTIFSGSFLQVWEDKHPRFKPLFYLLILTSVISIILSIFVDFSIAVTFSIILSVIMTIIIWLCSVSSIIIGYQPARNFLLAWSAFFLGTLVLGLLHLGIIEHNFYTAHALQIGSVIGVILLGYAFLVINDMSRHEKDRAIEKRNNYISELYNGLEELVEERTQQLSESESHLRTLIQTLPDLVWWKDTKGKYLGCNPKFERYVGAKQDEIIGKTEFDFISKEAAEFSHEKDRVAIVAGVACLNEEEITYADDGHVELLETVKMPMYDPDAKLIGILAVGRDITERRRSELALLNTQKMEAIGHLTGGIAHDFNNILAIIIGNLSLLKRQFTSDEKASKRIDTIEKSAKRAADLTKQLLAFSRKKPDQRTVTNINMIMSEMDSLIARSITPQVEITQKFADDIWNTEIDQGDFQDALINLVINARDVMPTGGHLTLMTENCILDTEFCELNPDMIEGEYVVLSVSDNGEGMTAEQQKHIFEPFFTTKEQGKGTGLGLAMVFGFVTRSKGFIKVFSEINIGTTIRIYLPKSLEQELTVAKEKKPEPKLPKGQETILVVDDEEALLELAQETLEVLNYKVLTALNGKQALDVLASSSSIDMLMSDVLMPGGMNGYELAEIATKRQPRLKVLLASGYTSKTEMDDDTSSELSANLLLKPYTLSNLAKRVRETLDG